MMYRARLKAVVRQVVTPSLIVSNTHCFRKAEYSGSAHLQTLSDAKKDLFDLHNRKHHYLRISLTERCNLRCQYCMPDTGVALAPSRQLLTATEVVAITRLFVTRFGIDKIRFTGGEPLLRKEIVDIGRQINELKNQEASNQVELCITSNGILLQRNLEALIAAGITRFNISLDSLVPAKFELISRRKGLDRVLRAIEDVLRKKQELPSAGLTLKINCVVQRGVNDDELCDFVSLAEHHDLEVRFIEYMPFKGNGWYSKKLLSKKDMIAEIEEQLSHRRLILRKSEDEPSSSSAAVYRVSKLDAPDEILFRGKIGFISSMSDHFCGSCNRLRLTADGQLRSCLFGTEELNLRDRLREQASEDSLVADIKTFLKRKHRKLGGFATAEEIMRGTEEASSRPMILIGG